MSQEPDFGKRTAPVVAVVVAVFTILGLVGRCTRNAEAYDPSTEVDVELIPCNLFN